MYVNYFIIPPHEKKKASALLNLTNENKMFSFSFLQQLDVSGFELSLCKELDNPILLFFLVPSALVGNTWNNLLVHDQTPKHLEFTRERYESTTKIENKIENKRLKFLLIDYFCLLFYNLIRS